MDDTPENTTSDTPDFGDTPSDPSQPSFPPATNDPSSSSNSFTEMLEDYYEKFYSDEAFYEFVVFMIPCFLFVMIALKRIWNLRTKPKPRKPIHKQMSYLLKKTLSVFFVIIYVVQIALASVISPELYWIAKIRGAAVTYLFGVWAWVLSYELLTEEVERGIYQRLYAHRLFWVLHFVVVIIKRSQPFEQATVPYWINICKLVGGFYLTLYAVGKPFDSNEAEQLGGKGDPLPFIRAILVAVEDLGFVRALYGYRDDPRNDPLLPIRKSDAEYADITSAQAGEWLKYLPIVSCKICEEVTTREDESGNKTVYYEIKTTVDDETYGKLQKYENFLELEEYIKNKYDPANVNWIDKAPPTFEKIEASSYQDEMSFINARREALEKYLATLGADPRYMDEKVADFLAIPDPHKSNFKKYIGFLAKRRSSPGRGGQTTIELEEMKPKKKTTEAFVPGFKVRCSHFQKSIFGDHYEYIFVVEDERDTNNYWSLIKTFTDFKTLNEKLEAAVNRPLPYFNQFVPKPGYQKQTMELDFIRKRKEGLDKYMSAIVKQPFCHTTVLYDFLEYDVKRGTRIGKGKSFRVNDLDLKNIVDE